MTSKPSVIAMLGLGQMGLPMATRLAELYTVSGFDPAPDRQDLARKSGIPSHGTAREALEGADIVFTAVRDIDQLNESLHGNDGILSALKPGATLVLTSTIGVDPVRSVAREIDAAGVHFVDAPISGGPARAGSGELLITVGADNEAFGIVEPILAHMSSTLKRIGQNPGDGQAMKTVNQLLCGIHIAAGAEALALAHHLGLDPAEVLETLQAGAAESFMLGNRGPRMLQAYDEHGAEVLGRLDIFVKDMGIVTGAARDLGLATPLAAAAQQLYLMGKAKGLSGSDDSSVIKVIDPREN